MSENDWICFYSPTEIPADKRLFGYDLQKKAGLGLSIGVHRGGCQTLLTFGYPGTGKSDYPFVLASILNQHFDPPFSVIEIKCDKMASVIDNPLETRSMLTERLNEAQEHKPLIISFDEIESMVPPLEEVIASRGTLVQWLRDYLNEIRSKTMLLAVTNYPKRVDDSVYRRLHVPIYFNPTPHEVVRTLIREFIGCAGNVADEIARGIAANLKRHKMIPMGANVIYACKTAIKACDDLNTLTTEEIVNHLTSCIPPTSSKSVQNYRKGNKDLIEFSEKRILPYWSERARSFLKGSVRIP